MCGIVALLSLPGSVSREALASATDALKHRGPDEQGVWVAPNRRIGLGHARLSIIDLRTGDQPIANEDEQLRVVVNGEFYDYARYRRELAARGHRLRTHSDSEILLHLYEEEGTECLRHLRGEFAFALWDEANGVLFAARDRFGIKPLYYGRFGDTLYLASEAKALFAAGVPARWDSESVFQDLHCVLDSDRSLFDGIYQVPAGHYLLASGSHLKVVRYWDLDFPRLEAEAPFRSESEYVELMRDELREAIHLRLQADVPVGCYLSGGLDSCAILGIAADLRDGPIESFTIAFDEGPFDEGPIAKDMAAHAGSNFHQFRMPEHTLAEHWMDAIIHCEMITSNANACAKYLLSRHARETGFKVVLTGEGADELLGGYSFFLSDMLRHDAKVDAPGKEARLAALRKTDLPYGLQGRSLTGPLLGRLDGAQKTLGFIPEILADFAVGGVFVRSLLASDFKAAFADRDPYGVLLDGIDVAGRMRGRSALHQSMYLWAKTVFPNKLLNFLGDRMEMAHSIEGRTPFLDHKLAETVAAMPAAMKIKGMTEKYVLREAARPYLTDAVYRRQKHPFLAPIEPGGGLHDLVQEKLRSSAFAEVPFFDQKAVVALLDRLRGTDDQAWQRRFLPVLMLLTSTCVLHEHYRM